MDNEPAKENKVTLLTARQVAERMSVSIRTLWRLVQKDQIPQPIRYNRKLVRWRINDLEEAGL